MFLSMTLSLSLQLFLRLSKQRSMLFRRMLRSVSWKLPARSDQRIALQFFAFLPKQRREVCETSFQQHQRQRLRKKLLWRKPQNLKVTTILCQVRTHGSYKNWTAKFYDLLSDQMLRYLYLENLKLNVSQMSLFFYQSPAHLPLDFPPFMEHRQYKLPPFILV